MLDCQYRHEFSDSNAWIALADVPPKELHWPLCKGWTLGWCRTLAMPVSVQSYGCCTVVVNQCLMLCHIQCTHSPAWSEQWPGTASEVCLCLLPTSNKWATTRMRLRASLHCVFSTLVCFLNEKCESHHSPRNFIDSSTGGRVLPILIAGVSEPEIEVQWNVWLCICGLQTWSHSLSPIPVLHSLPAVNVSLWFPGITHENRLPVHPQIMLWRCPWQCIRAAHWSSVWNMLQRGRQGSSRYKMALGCFGVSDAESCHNDFWYF